VGARRVSNGHSPYSWLKVKNPKYSQIRDRHELFESEAPATRAVRPHVLGCISRSSAWPFCQRRAVMFATNENGHLPLTDAVTQRVVVTSRSRAV
jgi:hypothetical protein